MLANVGSFLEWAAAKSRELLQGETLRLIGYGAILVIWIVTRVAIWSHLADQAPSLDAIAAAVTMAVAAVTEFARRYVWSPTSAGILEAVVASLKSGVITIPAGLTPAQAADFAARIIATLPAGVIVNWPAGQPTSTPLQVDAPAPADPVADPAPPADPAPAPAPDAAAADVVDPTPDPATIEGTSAWLAAQAQG